MIRTVAMAATCVLLLGGLAACEEKGPGEKLGMKIDHGVDTVKNGGKEPAHDKAEDAVEHAKEAVNDVAH